MFLGTHPGRCIWRCFTQEQPCRDTQQSFRCGCTHAKSDVAKETRSGVKNAFIPQKSHDLVMIWDKLQVFSEFNLPTGKHLVLVRNKSLWKSIPKRMLSSTAPSSQPASLRQRTNGAEPGAEYVLWTYLCGHVSPWRWATLGILSFIANRKGCSHLMPPPTSLLALGHLDW